jgi:hypothetical protein
MVSKVSVKTLEKWGRERLSRSFFLRDFLFSDIAAVHGFCNAPDNLDLAIATGKQLCENLLEPLQTRFGRITIRSAYRSAEVNAFGNQHGLGCASNQANAAAHIWDIKDQDGCEGAMACIVVPRFWDHFQSEGDWQKLAWWVHDHLPYSEMEFFSRLWAFNLSWHERPKKVISGYVPRRVVLTKPGMPNNVGDHKADWQGIEKAFL